MQIMKVLNNSSVLVSSEEEELIVLGKGIGFGKKKGETIDESKIEKKYVAKNIVSTNRFQQLINNILLKDFELSFDIIERIKAAIPYKIDDIIYLSLTDHISFAIQRAKDGIVVPNAVLNEVQMFYPLEFTIGEWAIEYIHDEIGIELSEDEAGFIALHIINAKRQNKSEDIEKESAKIVKDLIKIIEDYYNISLEKDEIDYHRLVTHLKFFITREFNGDFIKEEPELFEFVTKEYPEAYSVIAKIDQYFQTFYRKELPNSEKTYLTIHINRVLNY